MIALWKPTKNGMKLTQALPSNPVKHTLVADNDIAPDAQTRARAKRELIDSLAKRGRLQKVL